VPGLQRPLRLADDERGYEGTSIQDVANAELACSYADLVIAALAGERA
jgi:hypothetical protein